MTWPVRITLFLNSDLGLCLVGLALVASAMAGLDWTSGRFSL